MPLTISVGAAAAFAAYSVYSRDDNSIPDLSMNKPGLQLDLSASNIEDESSDSHTRCQHSVSFQQQMDQAGVTQIDEPVASATARALVDGHDQGVADGNKDASVDEPYCELSPIAESGETRNQGGGWGWGWFYKS